MDKDPSGLLSLRPPSGLESAKGGRITNPYLLETEACQRCFSQRSLPFTQQRL
jgi:ribosomal protein S27AE